MINRPTEKRIFVSYSHADRGRWRSLKKHLVPSEREGQISVWYDDDLKPGEDWKKRLKEEISDCVSFLPC